MKLAWIIKSIYVQENLFLKTAGVFPVFNTSTYKINLLFYFSLAKFNKTTNVY